MVPGERRLSVKAQLGTLVLMALCSCGSVARNGGTGIGVPASPTIARLLVDHHQHLFSPALVSVTAGGPLLDPVVVPAGLEALLVERRQAWNNPSGLAAILTPDAVVLGRDRRGWIVGRSAAAEFLAKRMFARETGLVPVNVKIVGDVAEVEGYYARGDPSSPQYIGHFHISAVRDRAGIWRISREVPVVPMTLAQEPITADKLISMLDQAGIRRAVVLSEAFWHDSPLLGVAAPYSGVVAENDWTLSESARYPDRLVPFCSFNPIADHALRELDRCSGLGAKGLKFSFAMSGVDIRKPEHLERVRRIFARANGTKLPIVIHLSNGPDYSREHAEIFLNQLLPAAPDIVVQVAHLWGGEAFNQGVLDAFVEAFAARRPAVRNLYFDLAEVWTAGSRDRLHQAANSIRQIGLERILYGSDAALNGRLEPERAWKTLRLDLPLTDAEFARIATNTAPYLQ